MVQDTAHRESPKKEANQVTAAVQARKAGGTVVAAAAAERATPSTTRAQVAVVAYSFDWYDGVSNDDDQGFSEQYPHPQQQQQEQRQWQHQAHQQQQQTQQQPNVPAYALDNKVDDAWYCRMCSFDQATRRTHQTS